MNLQPTNDQQLDLSGVPSHINCVVLYRYPIAGSLNFYGYITIGVADKDLRCDDFGVTAGLSIERNITLKSSPGAVFIEMIQKLENLNFKRVAGGNPQDSFVVMKR